MSSLTFLSLWISLWLFVAALVTIRKACDRPKFFERRYSRYQRS